jgi:sec-independent protein translocase protein TatC
MSVNTNSLTILGKHFSSKEPKKRFYYYLLIWAICSLVCLCFSSFTKAFIEWPYNYASGAKVFFLSSGPIREFISYMQMSLVTGLVISSPIVFYGLWRYLFALLFGKEKTMAKIWAIFSSISFGIGALLFFFAFAPFYFKDIVMVEKEDLSIAAHASVLFDHYISFITIGMIVTGFLFNIPMILVLLKVKKKYKD